MLHISLKYFFVKSTDLEQTMYGTYLQFYTKKCGVPFFVYHKSEIAKGAIARFFFKFIFN